MGQNSYVHRRGTKVVYERHPSGDEDARQKTRMSVSRQRGTDVGQKLHVSVNHTKETDVGHKLCMNCVWAPAKGGTDVGQKSCVRQPQGRDRRGTTIV